MLGWWFWKDEGGKEVRAATSMNYCGLDETWQTLQAFIDDNGPFDGVLGFSQGAALAALLCSAQSPLAGTFKFAILCAGFLPRDPVYERWLAPDGGRPLPTLPTMHIMGTLDERVPLAASERLASCFAFAQRFTWDGGHAVPSGAEFRHAVKAFLERATPSGATEPAPQTPPAAQHQKEKPHVRDPALVADPSTLRVVEEYGQWRAIRGL